MVTGYKLVCQFASFRDCPLYLASAETPGSLASNIVHDKWLPAESVHSILLRLSRKHNQVDFLSRKPFFHR